MTGLLDTHTLLWAGLSKQSLSPRVTQLLQDEANTFFVSAASAWEIATKVRLGKLSGAVELEENFAETVVNAGYMLLDIDIPSALRAGRFTADHRDPFDRMLAAQSITRGIPILSIDKKLDAFGVHRIWS